MPLFSGYDLIDWGSARLTDAVNFLRSVPSFFAPKPSTAGLPYAPPFTGGQRLVNYLVRYQRYIISNGIVAENGALILFGKIGGDYEDGLGIGIIYNNGQKYRVVEPNLSLPQRIRIISVTPQDGQPDSTDNLPNPNPNPSIGDDGLFSPNNPVIGDENGTVNPAAIVLSPAAPLILIGGGLAAAAAAAAAAQAASDALQAIKKVAESLDALKKLWEKLQEFLEEWEKDRPKNRDIVRQTYGSIDGDGAIDFYPLSNKNFAAIQVDIVVTEVPLGYGKYFGSMSPSRYRYKELGYISFYSINKGIIETHSIQFKRSSLAIPKTAVGFIYHFGLDNKIKGFAFGTFSVRKS